MNTVIKEEMPYRTIIREEEIELTRKLGLLQNSLISPSFSEFSREEQIRMREQEQLMVRYVAVLRERIDAFGAVP